jgi:peptidoglycan/xylan/chitin deacetylase (PgdA/CDA1 family)
MAFSLTVFMYHYVRPPATGLGGLPLERFEAQLDGLAGRCQVIGWPELQAALAGRAPLPERACLLTFDDGLCDHYDHVFPRLRQRGLPGLFFALARRPGDGLALGHKLHLLLSRMDARGLREALWPLLGSAERQNLEQDEARLARHNPQQPPDGGRETLKLALQRRLTPGVETALSALLERDVGHEREAAERLYLLPAQIAEMQAGGMSFGGHSQSHPWLDSLSADEQRREVEASARWLSGIEAGPWAFAYPYGGFDAHMPGCLAAAGFAAAFTTREQVMHDSRYHIGRYDGEWHEPAQVLAAAAAQAGHG